MILASGRTLIPRGLGLLALAGCIWIPRGADPDGDGTPSAEDCAPSDPEVHDPTTWYRDGDQDGDGDSSQPRDACVQPSGYSPTAGDCDDDDERVHPDADDLCGDGMDAACDGAPCSASLNDAYTTLFGEDGDAVGSSVLVVPDLTGDGQPDLVVGAEEHLDSGGTAGELTVISGGPIYKGSSPMDALAVLTLVGRVDSSVGSNLGHATAGGADLDGDGQDDLLVSAHRLGEGAALGGGVYLLTGPLRGGDDDAVEGVAARRWIGTTTLERAGYALALTDLDADGRAELAVGAYLWADSSHLTLGATYLIDDPMGDGDVAAELSDDDRLSGAADNDYLGATLATLGDTDGDGLGELAISASGNDGGATGGGAIYLLDGPLERPSPVAEVASRVLLGTTDGASAGSALADAGDVDGDGLSDLWIGARDAGDGGASSGATWLVTSAWLEGDPAVRRLDEATTTLVGDLGDQLGSSLAGGVDVDGDGALDVAVGAMGRSEDLGHAGVAYLLPGPFSEGSTRMSEVARRYVGPDAYAYAGRHLALGRGMAGTDEVDLVVASTDATVSNIESGAVYLLAGLDP